MRIFRGYDVKIPNNIWRCSRCLFNSSTVGDKDTSGAFLTNGFAFSFKIAGVCFRMIVLSKTFDID